MEKKYLPTRISKLRCLILTIILAGLYLIENSSIVPFANNGVFIYVIKPLLWVGLAIIVWKFPKPHLNGKIRLKELVNIWSFNLAIVFIIASVIAGFFEGFGKSRSSHTGIVLILNLVLVVAMLIGREFVRSYLLNSLVKYEKYILFVTIALLMTFIQFPFSKIISLKWDMNTVQFLAKDAGPELAKNVFAGYLTLLGGPIPSIIYLGLIQVVNTISPILPDLRWITAGLVGIACPTFSLLFFQSFYMSEARVIRRKDIKKENPLSWIIISIASIGIVWFSVGVFPVYPSVIATGSMKPIIQPGDIILIEKMNANSLKVGDIIYFKKGKIFISHRIIGIEEEDKEKVFRTKGDRNTIADDGVVKPDQVKGKVIKVVPKIGWPTLLLKLKKDIPLDKIEF